MFGGKDMPTEPIITRLPVVPMTVYALMNRPLAEIQNYDSEVLPLLRLWREYEHGFGEMLQRVPGSFYAVANFNRIGSEPDWCRQRINLFDMKIARLLLGKHWCKKPESARPKWIAIPEMATYLHYNMLWDVPIECQEKFFLQAPNVWRSVVTSGQFDLQVIGEEIEEAAKVRWYSCKTFHPRWTIDNVITSTEVRRKK
jgi:hypothetical protein